MQKPGSIRPIQFRKSTIWRQFTCITSRLLTWKSLIQNQLSWLLNQQKQLSRTKPTSVDVRDFTITTMQSDARDLQPGQALKTHYTRWRFLLHSWRWGWCVSWWKRLSCSRQFGGKSQRHCALPVEQHRFRSAHFGGEIAQTCCET